MQDFSVNGKERPKSVGFDATKRYGLVVTVGVLVNRTQEAILLDTLYQELADEGYKPFQTKSRDLSIPDEKIKSIITNCNGRLVVCIHQDDVNLTYAEAVHSAIALDRLHVTTDNTIAIVDGNNDKAVKLHQAASSIDIVSPAIVNCVRSELYYPHLLLADLVAGYVADIINDNRISTGETNQKSYYFIDTTRNQRGGQWGCAYSAVARNEGPEPSATFKQRSGQTVQKRVNCWFHGVMADTHSPQPDSDGIQPVIGRLNAMECNDVATWLAEQ